MKKILVVFDGYNFSGASLDFVQNLSLNTPFLLTGVFLSSIDYRTFLSYPLAASGYLSAIAYDNDLFVNNVAYFKSYCEKNGIEYRVHDDLGGDALDILKLETRFADLMVLGSETFFKDVEMSTPGEYLKDVLRDTECPILLLPEAYSFPEKLILTYDGGKQSMYALKQFAYIFPELCHKEATLVYGSTKNEDLPNMDMMEEFASRHYSNLNILKLDADPKKYFNTWLANNKNAMVISGAFGRTDVSMLFSKSFMTEVIAEHKVPVFIAHEK